MSKKVLIVEDDLFSANMFKQILHNSGFESIIVENGFLALEELNKDQCISTCLLDLNMPVMDGYEFLKALSS